MRLGILFGAGASYGAQGISPQPPLGGQLHGLLVDAFPESWGALPASLFTGGFEQAMQAIWTDDGSELAKPTAQELLCDLTLYFSRFELRSDTCRYSQLLSLLARRGQLANVGFATLNYECTFEQAAARCGYVTSYTRGQPQLGVLLSKVHGSCNWFPAIPLNNIMQDVTFTNCAHIYGGDIRVASADELQTLGERYRRRSYPFPAAMSLFAPGKHSPVAADHIKRVRMDWASTASHADVIVLIGARFLVEDTQVWKPVVDSDAHVWFVGATADPAYFEMNKALAGRLECIGETFEQAMGPLERRLAFL